MTRSSHKARSMEHAFSVEVMIRGYYEYQMHPLVKHNMRKEGD